MCSLIQIEVPLSFELSAIVEWGGSIVMLASTCTGILVIGFRVWCGKCGKKPPWFLLGTSPLSEIMQMYKAPRAEG